MMRAVCLLLFLGLALLGVAGVAAQEAAPTPPGTLVVAPGDTWAALALRFGSDVPALQTLNPHMNRQRQPVVGLAHNVPATTAERTGRLLRVNEGGWLQLAAGANMPPWALARGNHANHPFAPTLYRPVVLPGGDTLRELPAGFLSLEPSQAPAAPGQALGLRGQLAGEPTALPEISAQLAGLPVATTSEDDRFLGLVGTGAFFGGGEPELVFRVGDGPAWVQPWAFVDREWEYQELTLTGEAAEIDQAARDEERARLRALWTVVSAGPQWDGPFRMPLDDYLSVSANYGARRSYNGGPYLTYHEGVDFSAYGGTPVFAPAAGTVVLAEQLYVRGGAVIIDHGLGVFSGFYHLSAVHATPGQAVLPGDLLGEVGTTGLSTGNHLHWDLLINGVWTDAAAWQESRTACWSLEALGRACPAGG